MTFQLGVQEVPISSIRPNTVALREVDRKTPEYLGLVDSMRLQGFIGSINGRPAVDKTTGEEYIELCDGLHRFSAAKDAGIEKINIDVKNLTDDQVLIVQMMMNMHKIETKPAEYGAQLRRILDRDKPLPGEGFLTVSTLAAKLGCSRQFIEQRLQIHSIKDDNIKKLIDDGKICVMNAVALSKLPDSEQMAMLDLAMVEKPESFIPMVTKRKKEINEANKQGKDNVESVWEPIATPRKLKEIQEAMISGIYITEAGVTDEMTPQQAAAATLKWSQHLDPKSVADQAAKNAQREADKKAKNERMVAQKQAEKANRKQREATLEAEIAEQIMRGLMTKEQAEELRITKKAEWELADLKERAEQVAAAEAAAEAAGA